MSAMPEGCALAFDFGERRIGVAVGDTLLGIPHPLITIDTEINDARFAAIAALIAEWQPAQLVVGLPMHIDGTEHQMTQLARRFANRLKGRYGLPVWLVDERLTSVVAESMLEEAGVRGRKQKPALDQVAAQAILLTWFEHPGQAV
ncbi:MULTISPECIES: Holliday junction resolvase RuvX [Chromobacterium]|uniref:Holliday junction resolvase RuvX n=1 Tax=Chromobacterium TaxID=535 RepID=UPI000D302E47|nr:MULTISPECIES: Holliday junction resolvase RuvX [Chromobacterium]MCP1291915.1 Holliday junction resolvase RuvX [Chromobacterium sp. S0633]PTU63792.1 Holliday junction resolvase RuvX [Chromobacterium sp. Panama]UJB32163.1 Holliday junction resolvase RuvX [Chromobacterium sp. Beijing]